MWQQHGLQVQEGQHSSEDYSPVSPLLVSNTENFNYQRGKLLLWSINEFYHDISLNVNAAFKHNNADSLQLSYQQCPHGGFGFWKSWKCRRILHTWYSGRRLFSAVWLISFSILSCRSSNPVFTVHEKPTGRRKEPFLDRRDSFPSLRRHQKRQNVLPYKCSI